MVAGQEELAVLEEGELFEDPLVGFLGLEAGPFLGIEGEVVVGEV